MSKPTIRIYDCETNETIDREMTNDEFAKYEADQVIVQAAALEAQAKADAKAAAQTKLAALGLTVEDLQALGL
jgi:hypothetical protein